MLIGQFECLFLKLSEWNSLNVILLKVPKGYQRIVLSQAVSDNGNVEGICDFVVKKRWSEEGQGTGEKIV